MTRPKTAGERNESMMVEKAKKAMEITKDPVEKLRLEQEQWEQEKEYWEHVPKEQGNEMRKEEEKRNRKERGLKGTNKKKTRSKFDL